MLLLLLSLIYLTHKFLFPPSGMGPAYKKARQKEEGEKKRQSTVSEPL